MLRMHVWIFRWRNAPCGMECYAIWVDAMHECMKMNLARGGSTGETRGCTTLRGSTIFWETRENIVERAVGRTITMMTSLGKRGDLRSESNGDLRGIGQKESVWRLRGLKEWTSLFLQGRSIKWCTSVVCWGMHKVESHRDLRGDKGTLRGALRWKNRPQPDEGFHDLLGIKNGEKVSETQWGLPRRGDPQSTGDWHWKAITLCWRFAEIETSVISGEIWNEASATLWGNQNSGEK